MDRQYLGCHCKFSIYLLHITSMGCIADCYMAKHWKCNATVSIQFDSSIDIIVVAVVHSFISLCRYVAHCHILSDLFFSPVFLFSSFFFSFFDRRIHSVDDPSDFHRTKLHWNRIQSRFHLYTYFFDGKLSCFQCQLFVWSKQKTLKIWLMIKIEENRNNENLLSNRRI